VGKDTLWCILMINPRNSKNNTHMQWMMRLNPSH